MAAGSDAGMIIRKVSSVSYSDIVHFWVVETTGDPWWGSNSCSDEDTTPLLVSDAVVNTDAVKIGTYGLDCPQSSDYVNFNTFELNCGDLRYGFWFYATTWVDTTVLIELMNCTSSGDTEVRWRTGGEIDLRDGATVKETSSGAGITTGTWYFLELVMNDTGNIRQVLINGSSILSETDAWSALALTELHWGVASNDLSDMYFDNLMISDDVTRDFNDCCKNMTAYPSGACDG
jgi:hypothetical protein